jgi:dihydrofolate reductase
MSVNLIVAMCKNNGIGLNNKIPWKISEDMHYFSKKTSGNYPGDGNKKNAVIMGRNTWESLPKKYKPLPHRFNIVLTKNGQGQRQGLKDSNTDVEYLSSIDDVVDLCYGQDEKGEKGEKGEKNGKSVSCKFNDIWVIGGSSIYQEFIKRDTNKGINIYNSIQISKYYITYIDKDYDCDTYFPLLENMNKYHLTHFEKQKCIDNNTSNDYPLSVYYIVFKKIKYTDEKIIEELFTPYKSNNEKKSNLTLYVKNTNIDNYNKEEEVEIIFSMFSS